MFAVDGILVLDLCRRRPAGAYTAMFLGDFGARVIKVDPPASVGPVGREPDDERYAAYFALDRNKQSLVLDLRQEGGRQVLYRLAEKADVLIEGFRPGVMQQLKADYPTLQRINPRLIYCSLSGYGPDGPYAHLPGHDMNYIALAGALSLIGPKDGPPCRPHNFVADMGGAGLHGVIGILLALMAREKTGRGQMVDIAYIDGVISLLAQEASWYFYSGKVPRRGETTQGGARWAQAFLCQDGEYFTISCSELHFRVNLCRALGRDDLIPDYTNPTPAQRDRVVSELAKIFLTRTRDEWFKFFQDKDTCVAPVYYLNETFMDPQVLHRHLVVDLEHPTVGKVKQIGIPIKLSETPGEIRSLGVPVGANTQNVLSWLGYSPQEVQALQRQGVIE